MWSFGFDATTGATIWATVALVIFIGIAIYFGYGYKHSKLRNAPLAKRS